MPNELLHPFILLFTAPPHQVHPAVVHFPIALLVVEAVLLGLFAVTRNAAHARAAHRWLVVAFCTLPFVALAGFHDAGMGANGGNEVVAGLQTCWQNAGNLKTPVIVHMGLMVTMVVVSAVRLAWRGRGRPEALRGISGWAFGLGLSRLVMMKYQLDDIRLLLGGDLRFLRQFSDVL